MSRFPIEKNRNSFENRTHHRTFKRVKLNFQCNRVPIELIFKRYSFFKRLRVSFKRVSLFQTSLIFSNESHFFKRVSFFQTSPIFSNESQFLKRVSQFSKTSPMFWNESHFKQVSSYFQTSLMFSNESYVFKRVSFLNRVPFETSIVYESYRDDFYRALLAWFTRNLEWSHSAIQ